MKNKLIAKILNALSVLLITFALTSLCITSANAKDEMMMAPGPEVPASTSSWSGFEIDIHGIWQNIDDTNVGGVDVSAGYYYDSGASYAHFLGLNFIWLSDAEESFSSGSASADFTGKFRGLFLVYRPYLYLYKRLKLYAEGGIGAAFAESSLDVRSSRIGNFSVDTDDTVLALRAGVGLEYDITDNVSARVGYSLIYFDEITFSRNGASSRWGDDITNGISAGIGFRF